jgi:hypothetical protein
VTFGNTNLQCSQGLNRQTSHNCEDNIIGGRSACHQSHGNAANKSHGLGLRLAHRLRGCGAAFGLVQEFVRLCCASSYVAKKRRGRQPCSSVAFLTQHKALAGMVKIGEAALVNIR